VIEILGVIIAAALINNVVLVNLLGVSTLFSSSNSLRSACELALFSFIVLFLSSFLNFIIYRFFLNPIGLGYLRLIVFVGISSTLTIVCYKYAEDYFPLSIRRHDLAFYLIGANSAVIGISLLSAMGVHTVSQSLAHSFGSALGFAIVLIAFAALRQRLETMDIPDVFRGPAIQLVSAGIVSMCFIGLAGLI
jgi:electron transport complex protein RnfA